MIMRSFPALSALALTCAAIFPAAAFNPVQQPPETASVPGNLLFALSVEFPTGLQASYDIGTYTASNVFDGYFDNRKCYQYSSANELFTPVSQQNTDAGKTCPANDQWSGNLLNWLTMTNLDQFRSVMTGGTRDTVSPLSTAITGGTQNGDSATQTILIRSFSDRNSYHTNKTLPNTAAVPTAYRSALVRNGGYGTKFLAIPPITTNTSNSGSANTVRNCGPSSARRSCWTNQTGHAVTVTSPGTATTVANGGTWTHTNNNVVTVQYTWTTTTTTNPTNASFSDMGGTQQRASCASSPVPTGGACFNIRLQVCRTVTGVGMESNCVGYQSSSKPEGLVQQYANSLRYGAFGYLKEDGNGRDGGVLRAAMKSVGRERALGDGLVEDNPNREWNETSGIQFVNPDPDDATASSVSRSGVINYLNQFGYAAGYKSNDPVSELYHAALLYLRGLAPPERYVNNLNATNRDGFPVITGNALERGNSRDPLINTCQRNFLLTIGDIYTHQDGNINDPELNMDTLWGRITSREGTTNWVGGSGGGMPYIAGMAYWAHTNDIRGNANNPNGPQTIASYFVDVLENYNGQAGNSHEQRTLAASRVRTQYWLGAKYGGYNKELAATAGDRLNPNANRLSWDSDPEGSNGYGIPDNWYAGNSPGALRAGLTSAFQRIAREAEASSSSSAATTSTRQTSNSQIIYAGYDPSNWSGSLRACLTTQSATSCQSAPQWEASNWFNTTFVPSGGATLLTAESRKIVTSWRGASGFSSSAFRWGDIHADQQDILNTADNQGAARLAYLRGDRSQENTLFRSRPVGLLGDIVHSGVVYLAGPTQALSGPNFPDHAAYRADVRSRPAVVYVGANDGMLHAFSATNGRELFAYVPGSVFEHLPALGALNFEHRYFVDSTPMVGDVQRGNGSWGTYLVGGLGAGGRGYYALDITNQSSFATASEAALASSLPIWEFTSEQDEDLGYTFNEPSLSPLNGANLQIAKVADATVETGVWRVIVGNGYGSANQSAFLYMLDANTGTAATKLQAQAGPDNGLSTPTPLDADRDGLIDTVYAGDLLGNMHKFQFSRLSGSRYVLARPTDTGAAWRYIGRVYAGSEEDPEPIVSGPSIGLSCSGNGFQVAFGTGKLNEGSDYMDDSRRSFIALDDTGDSTALTVSDTLLAEIAYTQETLTNGRTGRTWESPDLHEQRGWRMHFTAGERVLGNPVMPPSTGAVLFATTRPTGDICTPGNTGYVMSVSLCNGASETLVVGDDTTGGLAVNSTGEIKLSPTYLDPENRPTVVCNQADCQPSATGRPPTLQNISAPRGRYNWREILSK